MLFEQDCEVKSDKMKDSHVLLKQKMCKTHDLIKQYCEKVKQMDHLKSNLETAKKEAKHTISNYKSAMDKVRELELKITENKLNSEKLMNEINKYKIRTDADQQTIQQLTSKIKNLENEHSAKTIEHELQKSSMEEKIKSLEQTAKKFKTPTKDTSKQKKRGKNKISADFDIVNSDIDKKSTSDIGINVSLCDLALKPKCEVEDKCIMTDEFYNIKHDPHPLFCAKCEDHLPPDLTLEKICRTMNTYPKLIEKDLSPVKRIHSPCSLSNTYSDSINKNEDGLSKTSIPYPNPYGTYNESIVESLNSKLKSESRLLSMPICENNELKNVDISRIPVVANLSSNNFSTIPATLTLSQNRNYTKEEPCPNDLLINHSSSIKQMERKLQLLETKVKKFRRLKRIDNNSCCRRNINCKDNFSLNSKFISIICKSVAEYYDKKMESCSKNKRNINSNKCTCCIKNRMVKKKEQLNESDVCKNTFSCKVESDEEHQIQDTCYNKIENATNSFSDINKSNTSFNSIDESYKRNFGLRQQSALHTVPKVAVKDNSCVSNDEICTSNDPFYNNSVKLDVHETKTETTFLCNNENSTDGIDEKIINFNADTREIKNKDQTVHENKSSEICANDNLLRKNNIDSTDMDIQLCTRTKIKEISLSKNENPTEYNGGKMINVSTTENRIKEQISTIHKSKVTDRILKKCRNLKRKTQGQLQIKKQENTESDYSSDYNITPKKLRIENENDGADCSLKNISLKNNFDTQTEFENKQESNKLSSYDYQPGKKLRIAHIPKPPILKSNIEENIFTHNKIKYMATWMTQISNRNKVSKTQKNNLLKEEKNIYLINKCNEINVKCNETNKINEKDSNLSKDCLQNIKTLFDINAEHTSEFKKPNDALVENIIYKNVSMDKKEETSNDNTKNLLCNIANNTANNLEIKKCLLPSKTSIPTKSQFNTFDKNSDNKIAETVETKKDDQLIRSIDNLDHINEALGNENHKISKDAVSNGYQLNASEVNKSNNNSDNVSSKLSETLQSPRSPSPIDTVANNYKNDTINESLEKIKSVDEQKETCINNEAAGIRTNETLSRDICLNQQKKDIDISNHNVQEIDEMSNVTPVAKLLTYINQKQSKKCKISCQQKIYIRNITDKFVIEQIRKFINSDWEDAAHDDVIQKLGNTCGPRIIAKCIVIFLLKEVDHDEPLDKSFTPPAPMMTIYEQKIIALLVNLEVLRPTVIYFVQASIEFNLFRLNTEAKNFHLGQVASLTRIYVVLSRIQKDREKIRMMCCNALYSMGLKSITVLYTVLTSWPEVLPNAETNKGLLPKCIAFLVNSLQIENCTKFQKPSLQKLNSLKNYISIYYKYDRDTTYDIVGELMTALKAKRIDGLDTAILLIAKRKGLSWTYENIISSFLLPMIIKNEHSCIYSAFSLLGRLLRVFSPQEENIVQPIIEQLCDLIKSGQGSHDQQQGIISALLSLSKKKFDVIAPFVIQWTPTKSLRPAVNTQLQAFINSRNSKFWKNYLTRLNIDITSLNECNRK
ncbi:putative leucine-rich repeat-containing protein DDB_G0290503 isoform X2 [Cardiocondyla obscurior]|uniref:putative leucine-rich repeat-containing protein DDB_G0290503 isoform X2 n=1 Tax=Cardiocondyla obscurior TaxID=286306 RepID=UPI0039656ADB